MSIQGKITPLLLLALVLTAFPTDLTLNTELSLQEPFKTDRNVKRAFQALGPSWILLHTRKTAFVALRVSRQSKLCGFEKEATERRLRWHNLEPVPPKVSSSERNNQHCGRQNQRSLHSIQPWNDTFQLHFPNKRLPWLQRPCHFHHKRRSLNAREPKLQAILRHLPILPFSNTHKKRLSLNAHRKAM